MRRRWAVPALCFLSSVFVTRAGIVETAVADDDDPVDDCPAFDSWTLEWDDAVACDEVTGSSTIPDPITLLSGAEPSLQQPDDAAAT
jgi:hypothetical protein